MLNEINDLAGQHEVPLCSILHKNGFDDKNIASTDNMNTRVTLVWEELERE